MNETMHYMFVLTGGIILGIIFYGGLFLTIKKGLSSKYTAGLLLSSFFLRSVITVTGFYFLSFGNLTFLMISMAGFIFTRLIIIRITRPDKHESVKKESL